MAPTKPLKILIGITAAVTVLSAMIGAPALLALSAIGLKHGFVWQPLTYLFVHTATRLDFSLLISLAFNCFVLYMIGSAIIETRGKRHFFALYFGGGLAAALVSLPFLLSSPLYTLTGNTTALFSLMITWALLNPEMRILLFFTIPMKVKWLVFGLLAANLLIDFANGDYVSFFALLGAATFSYLYTLAVWKTPGPFSKLHPLEKTWINFASAFKRKKAEPFIFEQAKVYDFRTGRAVLSDAEFMDAMLAKISLHGKKSLSFKERIRMARISTKTRK